MILESYRQDNGLTYDQLGALLGIKKSTTYNICRGVGELSLVNANKIEKGTGGKITIKDLLDNEIRN